MKDYRFMLVNRRENMFCILDKEDYSAEWVTAQDAKGFLKQGLEIKGLSVGDNGMVNMSVQKPYIPDGVQKKVMATCENGEMSDAYDVLAKLGEAQCEGINLKKLWALIKSDCRVLLSDYEGCIAKVK